MKYSQFEKAQMLSVQIENIKAKIKELQSALTTPQYYHLTLGVEEPGKEPIEFFSEDEGEYISQIVSRYLPQLIAKRDRLIREFEAL